MTTEPRIPTREQKRAEKTLRDQGATITFTPSIAVPHDHSEGEKGCFRCVLVASIARVNEGSS